MKSNSKDEKNELNYIKTCFVYFYTMYDRCDAVEA